MALKLNNYIAIVLFLPLFLGAQVEKDTVSAGLNQKEFVYSDSDQVWQNNKRLSPGLNKSDWEMLRKGLDYSEDSFKRIEKKDKDSKRTASVVNQDLGRLKYVWLILVVGIFIVVLVFLWPYFKTLNKNGKLSLVIEDEQPEEAALRAANLKQALDEALNRGDYRQAFRIRYLEVLQQMVLNNIIDYRKERTNMEYLRQIKDPSVHQLFKALTLYFEEVWYGEMTADRAAFNRMSEVFTSIMRAIEKR
jgi:hypothetical protein